MAPVARPENVLKRAEELEAMDKHATALELLYDAILSKRTRNVSLSFMEPIVVRFVELSVLLRKGKTVKDGLHQYKKLVVPGSVPSLEIVVDRFLAVAEAKVAEAQAAADQITIDDEDLEAEQSPEDLLMSTVSSEQTKDRTDREVVTPWLKFLWEAYRSVLDVLRNNSSLEALYTKVVYQAFKFCLKYQRKVEFRRLCELLRNHLQMAAQQAKQPNQTNPVDLSNPDTLQLFLDTRFEQLNGAVKLELWQEAFRSVEDVHTLLNVSRRPIKLSNMATYYETLARIFAVGNNHLFHAAAWAKFYSMVYHTRHNAPEGELQRIASFFLLSVLCIPSNANEENNSRNHRLSSLLNLSRVPTRETLMAKALAKNVLTYARPEIRDLYVLLEKDFHLLTFKDSLSPIIEVVGNTKAYHSYVKPLLQVIISRVFLQLSQAYTSVKLSFIFDLVSLPEPFNLSRVEIERLLVFGSHAGEYKVSIDHKNSSATFVDVFTAPANSAVTHNSLEASPAGLVRDRLRSFANEIASILPKIDDKEVARLTARRTALLSSAQDGLREENEAFLNRKKQQKELVAQALVQQRAREAEEAKNRAAKLAAEKEAERVRIAEESREREIERQRRELKAVQDEAKRKLAEEINAKGVIHVDLDKLDDVDADKLQRMQVEQLDKESKDLRTRMKTVARRYDHLERAYRQEEAALWQKDADEQVARDREAYEARREAMTKTAAQRAAYAEAAKKRFTRMVPAYSKFVAEINEKTRAAYEAEKAKNDALLEKAKAERTEKVLADRARAAESERIRQEKLREAEEERARRAKEQEERNATKYVPGALRTGAPRPGAPVSTPAAAAPRGSPFGAARPIDIDAKLASREPAAPRVSPFGAAKPVESAGAKPSPFGNARPTTAGAPKPSPFGNARPTTAGAPKPSPFGNAKPTAAGAAKPSPFGNAKPREATDAPKSSPFGNARPRESGAKASPFGNAKPKDIGSEDAKKETPAPRTGGAYQPPSRRH